MDAEKEEGDAQMIRCDVHQKWARSAVVCCHLVGETGQVRGFVENCDDPDDRQAWCGRCEQLFLEEDGMTERFRAFNDMQLVCEFCYKRIRQHHGAEADG